MTESDWSQFFPDIISGLIVGLIVILFGSVFAFVKSEKFRKWLKRGFNGLGVALKWLIGKWFLILLLLCFITLETIILRAYADWKIVVLSLAYLILAVLCCRLLANYPVSLKKEGERVERQPKFLPIPLSSVGNKYFEKFYIDPPLGDVILRGSIVSFV